MKKLKRLIIIAAFSIVALSACEKDATIKLPKLKPEPVIYCFIRPGGGVKVRVTMSAPVFGGDTTDIEEPVKDAIVKISDGSIEELIPFDASEELYEQSSSGSLTIESGKTYA